MMSLLDTPALTMFTLMVVKAASGIARRPNALLPDPRVPIASPGIAILYISSIPDASPWWELSTSSRVEVSLEISDGGRQLE